MKAISYTLICSLILINPGCSTPPVSPASIPDQLPFFRDAMLTPEWFQASDQALDSIHRIPAFSLSDQQGASFSEADMDGRICISNFFFTRCKSICPRMTMQLKHLKDTLGVASDIQWLSFSVDPEADSISVINAYANDYGLEADNWKLLTGNRDSIYRLARLGFFAGDSIGRISPTSEFLHTENVILTDGYRRIRGVYNGTLRVEMDRLLEDIQILRKEKDAK
jgi:protein SCO1/2